VGKAMTDSIQKFEQTQDYDAISDRFRRVKYQKSEQFLGVIISYANEKNVISRYFGNDKKLFKQYLMDHLIPYRELTLEKKFFIKIDYSEEKLKEMNLLGAESINEQIQLGHKKFSGDDGSYIDVYQSANDDCGKEPLECSMSPTFWTLPPRQG
jgi:hypothetical protein